MWCGRLVDIDSSGASPFWNRMSDWNHRLHRPDAVDDRDDHELRHIDRDRDGDSIARMDTGSMFRVFHEVDRMDGDGIRFHSWILFRRIGMVSVHDHGG